MSNADEEKFATFANMWRAIESFEAGTWDEVELAIGGQRLVLRVDATQPDDPALEGGSPPVVPASPRRSRAAVDAGAESEARPESSTHGASPTDASSTTLDETTLDDTVDADVAAVVSPTAGIFYAQSEPGAPPFVREGDRVEPDTTVCIVEIMKLMNHVKAGVAGRVVRILVDNAASIESGQALLLIEREHP